MPEKRSLGPETSAGATAVRAERTAAVATGERYTSSELLAVMSARLLKDGQVVFAGVGIPLLAATLAQGLHCPGLTILFEGGVIGPVIEPGKLPPSTNEQRCTIRANMVLASTDVLLLLQRGYVDIGFMGGAQIDQYGNLNSSFIGDPARPKTRLPGTGGGNDIASLAQMIVAMKHEKRRFVERVDFVTSPGFLRGGSSRRDSGLATGGMYRVVTDLGLFGFDEETKRMKVLALHADVTLAQVRENTGFELTADSEVDVTEPPRPEELAFLRKLDPERLYTAS
jgi:glutaconate CoA-transferase, subunit B